MTDIGIAIGLVLVIEGTLYSLFPGMMKSAMSMAIDQPNRILSGSGLVAAVLGFGLIWLLRS